MGNFKRSNKLVVITILFVIVAIVSVSLVVFNAMQAPPPMEIGLIMPLSGEAMVYGESIRRGADLAHEESNLNNISFVYEDTGCDPDKAEESIRSLSERENMVAVIGEACSGATISAVPVAEENELVLISPASTSPELSGISDYFFRTVSSDEEQGGFGAELVYENGYRNLAILYSNEEYGIGFREVLSSRFEELGGDIVAEEHFDRNDNDLRDQLTRIADSEPEAVYIISNSMTPSVAALRQIGELEISAVLFGSEAFKSDDIIRRAGEHAENLTVTAVSLGSEDFFERYNERFGENPGSFAAQGYDAFKAIAEAVKGGAHTSQEIKDSLNNISFRGASTLVNFNRNGEVEGGYDVYRVEEGEFVIQ